MKYVEKRPRSSQPRQSTFEARIVVDGFTLPPLLSFKDLTIVQLDIPCSFDLGDTQLKAMAEAWPRLRRFQLGSMMGWHLPPSITFTGILHLLRSCPELEYLVLPFDTSSEKPLPSMITSAHINKNITYLYIGNAMVSGEGDQSAVAWFLRQVFPNLCGIGGQWSYQTSSTVLSANWEGVVSLLRCK
ncbi:hypothetical protein BDZ97DRAFT_1932433 [Flammula alnicola]|nr:hypothetical protein BDZ97DRAFT_1932433 [Flammula alnicola]